MSRKKSVDFHKLAGSFRADRHTKTRLSFPPASGTVPRWLTSKVARAEWKRVAPLLLEQNLLLEVDLAILGAYCTAFGNYLECKALVEEQGHVVIVESQTRTGKTSKPIRNPSVTLMLDYQRAMLAAAAKLGFSPFDRERIEATASDDDSEQQPVRKTTPSKTKRYQLSDGSVANGDATGPWLQMPGISWKEIK